MASYKFNDTQSSCTSCTGMQSSGEIVPQISIPSKQLIALTANSLRSSFVEEQYVMHLGSFTTMEYRGCWRHVADSRGCGHDVYLVVTFGGVDQYINAIRECAIGCGIAALIAAIATEGAGGLIAEGFIECLYQCVKSRIGDIIQKTQFELKVDNTGCGEWSNH